MLRQRALLGTPPMIYWSLATFGVALIYMAVLENTVNLRGAYAEIPAVIDKKKRLGGKTYSYWPIKKESFDDPDSGLL